MRFEVVFSVVILNHYIPLIIRSVYSAIGDFNFFRIKTETLLDINFYIKSGTQNKKKRIDTFSLTRWFLKVNIKDSVIYLSGKIPDNVYVYEVS